MATVYSPPQEVIPPHQEAGFDVLDIFVVLARRWRMLVGLMLLFGIVGYAGSHLLKPRYSAKITFLVDQDTASTGIFVFRQSDPTIALLKSKAITEFLLQHIDAESFASEAKVDPASPTKNLSLQQKIQSETQASKSDDGVYSVVVQDPSPKRAVAVANAYLDALQQLSSRISLDSATRIRAFYQQQMELEGKSLEEAELRLKEQQEKTGLMQPGSQVGMEVGQIASYRSQLVSLQLQRATVAQSATDQNPQMVRLDAQINELQSKIGSLQGKINSTGGADLPSQTMEMMRLEREVRSHEGLVTSLATQYEHARLQENIGVPKVHVVDRASLPIPKTFPNRPVITAIFMALGLFAGLVIIVTLQLLERLRRDPDSHRKLIAMKQAFALRRV